MRKSLPPPFSTHGTAQVRRSRQQLRSEQGKQEQMCLERARENEMLEMEMSSLSSEARLLAKAMSQPLTLSRDERDRLRLMMLEEQAKEVGQTGDRDRDREREREHEGASSAFDDF